jgi:glycosyltransferase involved in cell wall biosynthesis
MNVCLISREYPPFFGGGIGTYNVQWAKALAAAGHRVVVVTVSDDGTTRRETAGGITVIRLPFLKGNDWSGPHPSIASPETIAAFHGLSGVAAFAMQVEKAMPGLSREFALDIIEVPDTGALAWFGLHNRRIGGSWKDCPPVVTTIHSPSAWIAHYNRQPLNSRADHELASMERDSALWSDALVSPSAALAEWTIDHWGIDRASIDTIPYPLGDLEQTTVQRDENTGSFRALFIGRLEPRKGIDTLLESLSHTNGLDLTLDLVGEDTPDPDRPGLFGQNSLRTLVPSDRRSRIRVHGRKTPAELPAIRDAAHAIVIPSPMDNFPYVCVEAMAEGRLVIASSRGGTAEMIRDGVDGFLFSAGDAGACAEALSRAAASSPDSRARLRESAARRIRDYCGNAPILQRRLAHYQRTIARSHAAPRPASVGEIVVINRGHATDPQIARLSAALRESGADFAHGWPRTEFEVHAFSTPTLHTLSLSPRTLGPILVRRDALETPAVRDLLQSVADGQLRTVSTWALAVTLCATGRSGVSVPEVIEAPISDLHPTDRDLVCQLDSIHASRGWRLLNRIYDFLHVLRGRGLRRPYHPRGRKKPGQV